MKKQILTVLLALALLSVLTACGQRAANAVETATPPPASEAPVESSPSVSASEPGTLLESGTGLNESYYDVMSFDFMGGIFSLTDSYFTMGTMVSSPEYGSIPGPEVTVRYDRDAVTVKLVRLWYYEDRYEIYAASPDDLQKLSEPYTSADVLVEDPEAEELWAKEIYIEHFEDLG